MAGIALGLDFGAVLALGQAQGADVELLAEVLPEIEPLVLAAFQPDDED